MALGSTVLEDYKLGRCEIVHRHLKASEERI
jgi:hypothetical protein